MITVHSRVYVRKNVTILARNIKIHDHRTIYISFCSSQPSILAFVILVIRHRFFRIELSVRRDDGWLDSAIAKS